MPADILPFIKEVWDAEITAGDTVIDATMGNGLDTAYLGHSVGAGGRVFAFDMQAAALVRTAELLRQENLSNVTLINDSHSNLGNYVKTAVKAVNFNLGYLPGGDKSITTLADTTLAAVKAALKLLKAGGVVTMVFYPGHRAGSEEAKVLTVFLATLSQNSFQVLSYQFLNRPAAAPYAVVIAKR